MHGDQKLILELTSYLLEVKNERQLQQRGKQQQTEPALVLFFRTLKLGKQFL